MGWNTRGLLRSLPPKQNMLANLSPNADNMTNVQDDSIQSFPLFRPSSKLTQGAQYPSADATDQQPCNAPPPPPPKKKKNPCSPPAAGLQCLQALSGIVLVLPWCSCYAAPPLVACRPGSAHESAGSSPRCRPSASSPRSPAQGARPAPRMPAAPAPAGWLAEVPAIRQE